MNPVIDTILSVLFIIILKLFFVYLNNIKNYLLNHWMLIISLMVVIIMSIMSMYSDMATSSHIALWSNVIACVILGIPTWIFLDIFLHLLRQFNNISFNNSIHIWIILRNLGLILSSIFIIFICIIFYIKERVPFDLLITHVKSTKIKYVIPFVTGSIDYFLFWLIIGIGVLIIITIYGYERDYNNLIKHFNFLKIWVKPIVQIISIFGIELTALSSLLLHIPQIDYIMIYFLYLTPVLSIMGVVLDDWYSISDKVKKDISN